MDPSQSCNKLSTSSICGVSLGHLLSGSCGASGQLDSYAHKASIGIF